MKKYIPTLILTALLVSGFSQTIVKMDVPLQSDEPVRVVALFDEEIPEGIPVVLGLMGYEASGGIEPYTFEWLHNGKVVSTSDVAIITPAKGDALTLKVTDKNRCSSTSAFNLRVATRSLFESNDTDNGNIKIYPTLINSGETIHIDFSGQEVPVDALVRIFDTIGVMKYETRVYQNAQLNLSLTRGIYFISVKTGKIHQVRKFIVQ